MSDLDEGQDGQEVVNDERQGTPRVVLLSVQVPLDVLPKHIQKRLPTDGPVEAWIAVSGQAGAVEEAIQAFSGASGQAGNTPGTYKAQPRNSWFARSVTIEPPLG